MVNRNVDRMLTACSWLSPICVLAAAAGTFYYVTHNVDKVADFIGDVSREGPVAYICLLALAYPLLLPAPLLQIFAGTVFPLPLATLVNYAGSIFGDLLAFVLGRYLFREALLAKIAKDPKLLRIDNALRERGFRTAVLLRLSPLVPDTWLNYLLGSGPIDLVTFISSTCSGTTVYSLTYASYGHALGLVAFRQSGVEGFAESPEGKATLFIGVLAALGFMAVLGQVASTILSDSMDSQIANDAKALNS
eukprot:TRINITY_DN103072_c0_g1_i1.p1 TRINITY_DN103072_c0_g1~~TRINITY_DN103072_c0_g1_i1.p1  ORF type:complete len:249 (-),score=27.51 TRINITY_DN103072_c0_g1_i1:114-860(-)